MKSSIALLAPFETWVDKIGSNLAASNSLTIALALDSPSFAVGVEFVEEESREVNEAAKVEVEEEEIENADETDSFNRFVDRVR